MLKAVIFDLDDTLYYELDYVKQAFGNVAEHLARRHDLSAPEVLEAMVQILEAEGRGRIFNRICEKYALTEDIRELVRVYRATKPSLVLYPDAERLLDQLQKQHIGTGLVTDGIAIVQRAKVEALNLQNRLDAVILTDELAMAGKAGLSKPDPLVYQACLEQLRVKAQEAVYIGDNPGKDFIGARALGMQTIRLIRAKGDHVLDQAREGYEADVVLQELPDYDTLLKITGN